MVILGIYRVCHHALIHDIVNHHALIQDRALHSVFRCGMFYLHDIIENPCQSGSWLLDSFHYLLMIYFTSLTKLVECHQVLQLDESVPLYSTQSNMNLIICHILSTIKIVYSFISSCIYFAGLLFITSSIKLFKTLFVLIQ